jgi:hypothetical protein
VPEVIRGKGPFDTIRIFIVAIVARARIVHQDVDLSGHAADRVSCTANLSEDREIDGKELGPGLRMATTRAHDALTSRAVSSEQEEGESAFSQG